MTHKTAENVNEASIEFFRRLCALPFLPVSEVMQACGELLRQLGRSFDEFTQRDQEKIRRFRNYFRNNVREDELIDPPVEDEDAVPAEDGEDAAPAT